MLTAWLRAGEAANCLSARPNHFLIIIFVNLKAERQNLPSFACAIHFTHMALNYIFKFTLTKLLQMFSNFPHPAPSASCRAQLLFGLAW